MNLFFKVKTTSRVPYSNILFKKIFLKYCVSKNYIKIAPTVLRRETG